MRVVILGASRFGAATAELLIEAGNEVVVIDRDHARLEAISDRMDCGLVEGDGTLPSVLRDAYRDEKDVFIALTNASDDNILACVVARSVGFSRVIPQITATEYMDVCEELDLSDAINPHAMVAENLKLGLDDDTEVDPDTSLHNQLALKRVIVPGALDGKTLDGLDLPESARAVAVIRGEDERFPEKDHELSEEDCILFAVKRDELKTLSSLFEA